MEEDCWPTSMACMPEKDDELLNGEFLAAEVVDEPKVEFRRSRWASKVQEKMLSM